jgi:predicted O-linked N-acetylglucosamine transferase (SPINDLY family)
MVSPIPDAAALQALLGQAVTLHQQGQLAQADALYAQVLAHQPGNAMAWQLRGVALAQAGQPAQALPLVEQALALRPDVAEIHNNRGMVLQQLRRFTDAVASHARAAELKPGLVDALNNQGVALAELGLHAQALAAYDAVLAQQPGFANAWSNRGSALRALGRHTEAARSYAQALALQPGFPYAAGHALFAQAYVCDWTGHADQVAQLQQPVAQGGAGSLAAEPFTLLAFCDKPQTLLDNARAYTAAKYPPHAQPLWTGERYHHDRIRVAYLSADFHDHATAYLMAEFFERHDRSRFDTIAISFGPDRQDGMRQRLQKAFGRFIDVREHSDAEVAQLLRRLEVDIAVDLKGYTQDCRTGILARRCAPVQVNYLGFPGTMGAPYIDYIVGDATVTPPGCERFYTEHIVRLPHSYQVNDRQRAVAPTTPSRAASGLPEQGFVFCCFNNNYKISPAVFAVWMRLLQRIPASVLWLLQDNAEAAAHLRASAAAAGVDPARLVWAPRVPMPEHLARQRLADLFLDTLPCNAHTTTSDALWVGLPVLTCLGEAFPGRVAASLLRAAGLPELVTTSLADYEALAITLATTPGILADLRARLERGRLTCPLFDTEGFVRSMEQAYEEMARRVQAGEAHRDLDF